MREMFFAEPPPFDTVMSDLRELEDRVEHTEREGFQTPTRPGQNRENSLRWSRWG